MIDFKSLGYKDITKDKPIRFSECLGEFFESTYPYNKRFYKKEWPTTIELKVGNCHNIVFIAGICYYHKGWEKFEVCVHKDYADKMFTQTLNKLKKVIAYKIMKDYESKKKKDW